jgi:hypothetical protein
MIMKKEIEKQLDAIREAQKDLELTPQEIKSLESNAPKSKPTVTAKSLPARPKG